MTVEEHRDDTRYLAKSLSKDPGRCVNYDHETPSLPAYSVETRHVKGHTTPCALLQPSS